MTDAAIVSSASPPVEAFSILQSSHIGHALTQTAQGLGRTRQVSVSLPVQLFRLTLADLDSPDPVRGARPVGWQYLIWRPGAGRRESTPLAVVDLTNDANDGLEFTGLHPLRMAQALAAASEIAETRAKAGHGRWEARVLEIPAIHLTALWLISLKGSAEFFVLLHPGTGSAKEIADINSEIVRRAEAKHPHSGPADPAENGRSGSTPPR